MHTSRAALDIRRVPPAMLNRIDAPSLRAITTSARIRPRERRRYMLETFPASFGGPDADLRDYPAVASSLPRRRPGALRGDRPAPTPHRGVLVLQLSRTRGSDPAGALRYRCVRVPYLHRLCPLDPRGTKACVDEVPDHGLPRHSQGRNPAPHRDDRAVPPAR